MGTDEIEEAKSMFKSSSLEQIEGGEDKKDVKAGEKEEKKGVAAFRIKARSSGVE